MNMSENGAEEHRENNDNSGIAQLCAKRKYSLMSLLIESAMC